jgi:hypothetical protein
MRHTTLPPFLPRGLGDPKLLGEFVNQIARIVHASKHGDDLSPLSRPLWDVLSSPEKASIYGMLGEERTFNDAYIRRIKTLREALGWTQEEMATALGVPLDRYKKYETRSPLPPYLVERFALIVRREPCFVLTGKALRQTKTTTSLKRGARR